MAKGSFSLLRRLLVAGTVLIVQQNTLWSGANLDKLFGRVMAGGTTGEEGMMLRFSIRFTGCRLGSLWEQVCVACQDTGNEVKNTYTHSRTHTKHKKGQALKRNTLNILVVELVSLNKVNYF